jgi:hypothetical protein
MVQRARPVGRARFASTNFDTEIEKPIPSGNRRKSGMIRMLLTCGSFS